jgi:hypothetical protein
MATFDNYNSDSEQHNSHSNNNTHQHSQSDNVIRATSAQRISFEHSSLTSDSGGRTRSLSSGAPPTFGEGQATGTYLEGRDLSRRPNIHRSHLSSSIQTGILQFI